MTASSRARVPMLALCLVVAAAMQPAAQPVPAGASGLKPWSPRKVFESSIALEIEVQGTARPTPSERKDGYVAVGDVGAGDVPGEWVATTPHAAHWFDAQWRQVAVTDLGRRFRSLHPVRFHPGGPVTLVAEQGDIDRLIEFDRRGVDVRHHDVHSSAPPVFGDFDGDERLEVAVVSGKAVHVLSRAGALLRALPFDTVVTELDVVPSGDGRKDRLLVYRPVRRSRETRLEVIDATGAVAHGWTEASASRYSVVAWDAGARLIAHLYGALRLRDVSGTLVATRDSGYNLRTRYARAVKLGSGHEVFLLYNRHYGTSALVVFDASGRRVHVEHPGGHTSTLWTMTGAPDAFYTAVGPDIVRYRVRP